MTNRLLLLAVLPVSFWPLIPLYWQRMALPEERWCGLLALSSATYFAIRECRSASLRPFDLKWPIAAIAIYVLSTLLFPKVLVVLIALGAVAVTVSSVACSVRLHVGITGLIFLSLPVLSRAQLYFGYPLRLLVGTLTIPILRISGIAVIQEGTVLSWGGELIVIDAPCSGIRMLWATLFFTFVLCCLYRLSGFQTILASVLSIVVVVMANAWRSAALFQLETTKLDCPEWMHEGVGMVVFVLMMVVVVVSVRAFSGRAKCAT